MDQKPANTEPDFLFYIRNRRIRLSIRVPSRNRRIAILLLMVIALLLALVAFSPDVQLHASQLFFIILEAVLGAWLAKD